MDKNRPVIGIVSGNFSTDQHFSTFPSYALRENYCDAVVAYGGLPIILPQDKELVAEQIDIVDGIIFTGGPDYPAEWWGEAQRSPLPDSEKRRIDYDMALMQKYFPTGKPFLGICAGEQLLNVICGGTVHQHLPDDMPGSSNHFKPKPVTESSHPIMIEPNTLLQRIAGSRKEVLVNSAHHQAVGKLGEGIVVNAKAPDGVIEGIEYPGHRFCLGLQWHPEFLVDPLDGAIFKAFVDACRAND